MIQDEIVKWLIVIILSLGIIVFAFVVIDIVRTYWKEWNE